MNPGAPKTHTSGSCYNTHNTHNTESGDTGFIVYQISLVLGATAVNQSADGVSPQPPD